MNRKDTTKQPLIATFLLILLGAELGHSGSVGSKQGLSK